MKILLVEDSRTLKVSNERALLKAGYEVICAEDGEAALQCAKEQMPDLILLRFAAAPTEWPGGVNTSQTQ